MSAFISTAVLIWVYWGIFIELGEAAYYDKKKNAQLLLGVSLFFFLLLLAYIWS